jgi:HAD superfamily phosphatase (TIGR01668 family)
MFRIFRPHLMVQNLHALTPERLAELTVDSLLLDFDGTLAPYRSPDLAAETVAWLEGMLAAGVRICLLSNGRGRRIREVAQRHRLPYVALAWKPLPFGCWRALRETGFSRRRTAIVGDQLFADVLAGALAGLTTILVEPIQPEREPWYTRFKRPLERLLLGPTRSR